MNTKKSEFSEGEWKSAVITQIKYRKNILGTSVEDKQWLQLSANRKDFSTDQLE